MSRQCSAAFPSSDICNPHSVVSMGGGNFGSVKYNKMHRYSPFRARNNYFSRYVQYAIV